MQKTRFLTTSVVLAVLVCAVIGALRLPGSAHPSIDIVASNWKFTPNTITVPVKNLQRYA